MRALMISSTTAYTGKSGIALAMLDIMRERGIDAGYFKPVGAMPVSVNGVATDADAYYIAHATEDTTPLDAVCPVVLAPGLVERVLKGTAPDLSAAVTTAFHRCGEGRDVLLVEGPSDATQGSSLGLGMADLAGMLEAPVALVHRPRPGKLPDEIIGASVALGASLAGVVFNSVPEPDVPTVSTQLSGFLATHSVPVFGVLPHDPALESVTVAEIVDGLGGTVLSAEERLDEPVESFMVGAMGQEKALRFFRRKARKAVITGGDRADVQMAALETNTHCVVLTGNMPPSSAVLARAEELGVPMVLVDTDTLTAVERMESLMGHTRLHDPRKAARIRDMLAEYVDIDAFLSAAGIV